MTKSSLIVKTVCDETGCNLKKVRYKSIPSNLKTHMMGSALGLQETFVQYARSNGMYRRVVSFVANFILLSYEQEINDWFRFYHDVWSAVAFYFSKKNMPANYLKQYIDSFFQNSPPSAYMKKELEYKTPALARQQECTTMSVNTILHLKQFVSRLQNVTRATIVAHQKKHYGVVSSDAQISKKMVDCIVCAPEEYNDKLEKLRAECANVDPMLFAHLESLLEKERARLGELVSTTVSYKVKTTNKTGTLLARILEGNKGDELLYRLIPHLKRYSNMNQKLLKDEGLVPKKKKKAFVSLIRTSEGSDP